MATVRQQHMPPGSCRQGQVSPGSATAVQSTRRHSHSAASAAIDALLMTAQAATTLAYSGPVVS